METSTVLASGSDWREVLDMECDAREARCRAYANPNRPESDVVEGDLYGLSYPFDAKFGGVCGWSGDSFRRGDKIRMTSGLDRKEAGKASVPVLAKWLPFNWGRTEFWVVSVDHLLAEIDRIGKVWVWSSHDRNRGTVVAKNADGTYSTNGCGKRSKAQIVQQVLRHARVYGTEGK